MAIPLLLAGAAIVAGIGGAKKGYDAINSFGEAKKIGKDAEEKHRDAIDRLQKKQGEIQEEANNLGILKNRVYQQTILDKFMPIYKKFNKINSNYEDTKETIAITEESIESLEQNAISFTEAAGCLISSVSNGAAAGMGALGLAGAIGTASTGTAISTLSGAAATNATLAWFGGGSLAAGGFGMAGGALVLGGIVAGPILAVSGFMAASKAEEAYTKAIEYAAKIEIACENIEALMLTVSTVGKRIEEFNFVINELDARLLSTIERMKKTEKKILIRNPKLILKILFFKMHKTKQRALQRIGLKASINDNFLEGIYSDRDLKKKEMEDLFIMRETTGALKKVLEIPLLDEKGKANDQSAKILKLAKSSIS
ncbi:hypothetical protein [Dethiosulfovibrio salsuginis]|uniref:Uncharacterized protein n=1 Tax=Dethiosulfovibrio salsuginis TaxID=561720 RepID=A0A1X7IN68_9BACT|nr:hypothetical protein [Dethiosulfovibrio salsuginis]SMG16091.1 hypothetical protein SAMN06275492_10391 [Dethiosulfovibrio salsuginis]